MPRLRADVRLLRGLGRRSYTGLGDTGALWPHRGHGDLPGTLWHEAGQREVEKGPVERRASAAVGARPPPAPCDAHALQHRGERGAAHLPGPARLAPHGRPALGHLRAHVRRDPALGGLHWAPAAHHRLRLHPLRPHPALRPLHHRQADRGAAGQGPAAQEPGGGTLLQARDPGSPDPALSGHGRCPGGREPEQQRRPLRALLPEEPHGGRAPPRRRGPVARRRGRRCPGSPRPPGGAALLRHPGHGRGAGGRVPGLPVPAQVLLGLPRHGPGHERGGGRGGRGGRGRRGRGGLQVPRHGEVAHRGAPGGPRGRAAAAGAPHSRARGHAAGALRRPGRGAGHGHRHGRPGGAGRRLRHALRLRRGHPALRVHGPPRRRGGAGRPPLPDGGGGLVAARPEPAGAVARGRGGRQGGPGRPHAD
mmetsp:Transcript_78697/g.238684  ORF Transcript_78697/g.238684 Transcript_78697/m.238684 type:complete len:421 (+) Transcript_78697:760-2022(+)